MSNASRQRGTLSLTVVGAKEYFQTIPYEDKERRSPSIELCGAKWELRARRMLYEGSPYLAAFIYRSDQAASPWSLKVTAVVRVCKQGVGDDHIMQFNKTLSNKRTSRGYHTIAIEELLDPGKGFVKNNTVAIVAKIMVSPLATSEAVDGINGIKRRCTDVKITVGDRHFYANKGSLAVHCDYFSAKFYGDDGQRDGSDIRFDDMDPDAFATFLKVLLSGQTIEEGNVAVIMPVANYFGARTVVEQCEEIIVNYMDFRDQILILDKCGINDLREQLLSGVLEEELEEVASSEIRSQLSAETKDFIIEELMRRRKKT